MCLRLAISVCVCVCVCVCNVHNLVVRTEGRVAKEFGELAAQEVALRVARLRRAHGREPRAVVREHTGEHGREEAAGHYRVRGVVQRAQLIQEARQHLLARVRERADLWREGAHA